MKNLLSDFMQWYGVVCYLSKGCRPIEPFKHFYYDDVLIARFAADSLEVVLSSLEGL